MTTETSPDRVPIAEWKADPSNQRALQLVEHFSAELFAELYSLIVEEDGEVQATQVESRQCALVAKALEISSHAFNLHMRARMRTYHSLLRGTCSALGAQCADASGAHEGEFLRAALDELSADQLERKLLIAYSLLGGGDAVMREGRIDGGSKFALAGIGVAAGIVGVAGKLALDAANGKLEPVLPLTLALAHVGVEHGALAGRDS